MNEIVGTPYLAHCLGWRIATARNHAERDPRFWGLRVRGFGYGTQHKWRRADADAWLSQRSVRDTKPACSQSVGTDYLSERLGFTDETVRDRVKRDAAFMARRISVHRARVHLRWTKEDADAWIDRQLQRRVPAPAAATTPAKLAAAIRLAIDALTIALAEIEGSK